MDTTRNLFRDISGFNILIMSGLILLFSFISFSVVHAYVGLPVEVTIVSVDELVVDQQLKLFIKIESSKDIPDVSFELKIPFQGWSLVAGQTVWSGSLRAGQPVDFEVDVIPTEQNPMPVQGRLSVAGSGETVWDMIRLDGQIPMPGKAIPLEDGDLNEALPRFLRGEKLPTPDPIRHKAPEIPGLSQPAADNSATSKDGSSLRDDVWVRAIGRFVYTDDHEVTQGVREATVELIDHVTENCATELTDINGYFDLSGTCGDPISGPDLKLRICAESGAGKVMEYSILSTYCAETTVHYNFPGGTKDYGTLGVPNDAAYHLYSQLVQAWQYMADQGTTVPSAGVEWPSDPCGTACYIIRIHIPNGRQWDEGTFFHEYGHHILDELAENPSPDYGSDDTHYLWEPEIGYISWTEGWPNFFSAVQTHRWGHDNHINLGGGQFETHPHVDPYPGQEDHIEGYVAALLWDIYDGDNQPPTPAVWFLNDDQHNDGSGARDDLYLGFDEIWDVVLNYDPPGSYDNPVSIHQFWDGMKEIYPQHINKVSEVFLEQHIVKPQPDLLISALSDPYPESIVLPGSLYNTTVSIVNDSSEWANGTITNKIYLSTNNNITKYDTEIHSYTITDLAPGGLRSNIFVSLPVPDSITPGTYYLGACVDYPTSVVPESNEDNNCRASTTTVTMPSIEVTSPDFSTWYVGASEAIEWSSTDAGPHVMIEVSRDTGSTWSVIQFTSNDGSYNWNVTGPTTSSGRIRVTSNRYPLVSDSGKLYIDNRSISVTSPDSIVWYVGDTKEIIWKSGGAGANVKIEVSHDAGSTWSTIVSSTSNDGAYDWNVTGPVTKHAAIRVTSISYPSVSGSGALSIANRPINRSINVSSPDFNVWYVGDNEEITWTSKEAGANVKIEVSRNSGSTWSTINLSTSNDGAYSWNVSGPTTKQGRIRVTSTSYSSVSDTGGLYIAARSIPTIVTTSVSSITTDSASSGGNVTADGGASVTARGVCWSTSTSPTISSSKTTDGTGTGSFTSSITGLSSEVTYHTRAYATNSVGTAYGGNESFTTMASLCSVCSTSPVVLTDIIFDTDCECRDSVSITIGNRVTFKSGAKIIFIAPIVKFQGESNAEMEAVVVINTAGE